MRRVLSWISVMVSGAVTLGFGAGLGVAVLERDAAEGALHDSLRARAAEVSVVKAQGRLTGTDVGEALTAIRQANQAAGRVATLTRSLAASLEATVGETTGAVEASREGAGRTTAALRETEAVAELLAAIAGYQASASSSADETNKALRRILRALRETNRELSGQGALP